MADKINIKAFNRSMQKLRRAYPELQADAKNNFDKVTLERARMLHAYSNKEYESQVAQGEYGNLDQLDFYRQKFHNLVDLFNNAIANKTKKSKLQADVNTLIARNYNETGHTPQGSAPNYVQEKPPTVIEEENNGKREIKEERPPIPPKSDPKDVLQSYFENKVNEIQRQKVGFRSVLESMPKTSQKRNVKASHMGGSKINSNNDREINSLNQEIRALSRKLQQEKESNNFNQGIYQVQKQQYENRIRDLAQQIETLRINQSKKNQESHVRRYDAPEPQQQPQQSQPPSFDIKLNDDYRYFRDEDNSPHGIRYRENDLFKIKQKIHFQDDSFRQSGHNQPPLKQKDNKLQQLVREYDQSEVEPKVLPNQRLDLQSRHNEFQKSNLRFARSEADNEDKNITIRSKISFFRPEVVLYRGDIFEVAVKTYDLVQLSTRKIMIFVNNKDKFDHSVNLTYTYDNNYYDVNVVRKIKEVPGCKQAKGEVHVKWKDRMDFDSMIEVKMNIQISSLNSKEIKFLLPAMFVEFSNKRPEFYAKEVYEKSTITPAYQFSSIYLAQEVIPFEKDYEDRVEVAKIFCRSKHHQGYLRLRWKVRGQVEVETIKPWSLLFSYLLSKEY